MTATVIISSVCISAIAFMIRKPRPFFDANISASSTPSSVTVKPMRSPAMTSGSVAGMSMVMMVCHGDRCSVRADFR